MIRERSKFARESRGGALFSCSPDMSERNKMESIETVTTKSKAIIFSQYIDHKGMVR